MERFVNEDGIFVVDSGATAFLPFWTYVIETEMLRVLRDAGRRVYVHLPISGGEMLHDTLLGFNTLAKSSTEKNLVVWINEYFGPVARDGKQFDQMQVYLEHEERIVGCLGLLQRSPDTYGQTIRTTREKKLNNPRL